MTPIIWFALGIAVGSMLGIMIMGLMCAAREAEDASYRALCLFKSQKGNSKNEE